MSACEEKTMNLKQGMLGILLLLLAGTPDNTGNMSNAYYVCCSLLFVPVYFSLGVRTHLDTK